MSGHLRHEANRFSNSRLWERIAAAALKLAPTCPSPQSMYHAAKGAADVVINMRFVARSVLAQAFHRKCRIINNIAINRFFLFLSFFTYTQTQTTAKRSRPWKNNKQSIVLSLEFV